MEYVYATLLPDGAIKVGFGSQWTRAAAGQSHNRRPVQVLACWLAERSYRQTRRRGYPSGGRLAERAAHQACAEWRLHPDRELFYSEDWLWLPSDVVGRIASVLGAPITFEQLKDVLAEKDVLARQRLMRLYL